MVPIIRCKVSEMVCLSSGGMKLFASRGVHTCSHVVCASVHRSGLVKSC